MYNMIMYNTQLSELLSCNKQSHFYSLISVLSQEDSALAHCHDLLGSWECGLFKFRTPQAVSGSAAGLQEGASCTAWDWGHKPDSSEVCLLLLPRKRC